jgi:predicted AAA+ superfamily ATPase
MSGPLRRSLDDTLADHVARFRQMAFVSGPRQVGKTTTCRAVSPDAVYLNWDDQDDRRTILAGPRAVAERAGLDEIRERPRVIVLDEIHKYRRWKTCVKGLFDRHADHARIVVTGSSRMDVYRRGGDSLMGRFLHYRMHPLSVGEIVAPGARASEVLPPSRVKDADWTALVDHGGFPEPFVHRDRAFSTRWRRLRTELLVRQDVRDLTRITELGQLESLVAILSERSGTQISYSNLAGDVSVSVDTARRWIATLVTLHHGFLVRPWTKGVARAIRKEPRWYLRDWSGVADPGRRTETVIACHLLKAVETWEDAGLGRFELRSLRDKDGREADFLVVRDGKPWFVVEAKHAERALDPLVAHWFARVGAVHAFQVVLDMPHVGADAFSQKRPVVVPARSFLSQLP